MNVGYIRNSDARQDDSPETQKSMIRGYAQSCNMEIDEWVEDPGISGYKKISERPGGKRLFEGGISCIITIRLDRLFRNTQDALNTVEYFENNGIALHIINMGGNSINTNSAMGKMMLTVLAGIDEMYRNKIAEDTSASLKSRKNLKKVYTREVFGYDKVDGKLVPNEQELDIVRTIFNMRKNGYSMYAITNYLNEKNVKTKQRKFFRRKTIKEILENPIHFNMVEEGNK